LYERQTQNLQNNRLKGVNGDFYITQWQVAAKPGDETLSVGLERLAVDIVNPVFYSKFVNTMSPNSWPTVIWQDYYGIVKKGRTDWYELGSQLRTFCIGLNLYLVSENCNIDGKRHPFFVDRIPTGTASRLPAPWNGLFLANGTKIDTRPAGYVPWWEAPVVPLKGKLLPNGTAFATGLNSSTIAASTIGGKNATSLPRS
jgi:hypothetical protein